MRKAHVVWIAYALVALVVAGCGIGPVSKAERGRLVFRTCVPCHGEHGTGNADLHAPNIAGLPEWYVALQLQHFKADIRGAHPDDTEGARMRPMARTLYHPGDLEAVAAYVAGLPPRNSPVTLHEGNVQNGQTQFTAICITCHMADGKGNKDLGAPPLPGQADWYLLAQLKKFHSGMRGAHPDDTMGAQMRAMSMTLADSTAMADVVAYIKTLAH